MLYFTIEGQWNSVLSVKAHLHDKRFGHGTPENEHPCQNSYFAIYLFTRQFFAGTFL